MFRIHNSRKEEKISQKMAKQKYHHNGKEGIEPTKLGMERREQYPQSPKTQNQEWNGGSRTHRARSGTEGVEPTVPENPQLGMERREQTPQNQEWNGGSRTHSPEKTQSQGWNGGNKTHGTMNGTEGVKPTVPKTQSQGWNGGNKTHGTMNGTEGVKPTEWREIIAERREWNPKEWREIIAERREQNPQGTHSGDKYTYRKSGHLSLDILPWLV